MKKYKFDIQKAVNTPINAISPVSGDHLRDKLNRLLKLISGHQVDVAGKTVSVKDHPDAAAFSKHLTARMIVVSERGSCFRAPVNNIFSHVQTLPVNLSVFFFLTWEPDSVL